MAEVFIIASPDRPLKLHVNACSVEVSVGVNATIDDMFIPVLETASGVVWRYVGDPGPAAEPVPSFDPDAVIAGTIEEVTPRLEALSHEQLLAVLDAEIDREVPRKGIRAWIEKIITRRNDAA